MHQSSHERSMNDGGAGRGAGSRTGTTKLWKVWPELGPPSDLTEVNYSEERVHLLRPLCKGSQEEGPCVYLHDLSLEGFQPAGFVQEVMESFVAAPQLSYLADNCLSDYKSDDDRSNR